MSTKYRWVAESVRLAPLDLHIMQGSFLSLSLSLALFRPLDGRENRQIFPFLSKRNSLVAENPIGDPCSVPVSAPYKCPLSLDLSPINHQPTWRNALV
jgi:hypothetical protein